MQTGSVENAVVYWLDLQLTNHPSQMEGAEFGWKSSYRHWSDDAVWALGDEEAHTPWEELRYAQPHPLDGISMDMAFALYGELRDCGDAPAPYPTLLAGGIGAFHLLVPGPWLGGAGDSPDPDPDGQPDANALGDDNNGATPDDENGVVFPMLVVNQATNISIEVSNPLVGVPALVDAWIDWNADGDWSDANEQILSSFALPMGINSVPLAVPPSASNGWTFARFRIGSAGGLAPGGQASDGEVEDYRVFINAADWGDAPGNPTGGPGYPTLAADNGACHVITAGVYMGTLIDAEPNGLPALAADGDDLNGLDDEDGVVFTSLLIAGLDASCEVTVSTAGYLAAWIDGNTDYDWDDSGEQVIAASLSAGTTSLSFTVPAAIIGGSSIDTYMRFRFGTQPVVGVRGLMPDGEVEDYRVTIDPYQPEEIRDFGDAPDAPYPTLAASGGAAHLYDRRYILGALWDDEADGQPTNSATGDDLANQPDEDGVGFAMPLIRGSNTTVSFQASANGFVSAWFDFDQDGTWSGAGEHALVGATVMSGVNNLAVAVPSGSALGPTYARFRYTSIPGPISATGLLVNGEVEDYMVDVWQSVVPGSIVITNITVTQFVSQVWWQASNDTLTAVQTCTNLVTNANAWADATLPSLARYFSETNNAVTSRFYRVYAPYVTP